MQRIGQSGRGTASAVPGGLFAPPPETQTRERLDGKAGGRANSSSVPGGIFGGGNDNSPAKVGGHRSQALVSDGIEGFTGNGDFTGAGYGGGYTKVTAAAFEGAAGGKSTNAGQIRDGHFRGGTVGNDQYVATTASRMGVGRGGQVSNRPGASANFLDSLAEAEKRDAAAKEEEQQLMAQLQEEGLDEPISEEEAIMAAAEQLAEEMGLDEAAHRQLEQRLLANHYAKQQQQQQMYMQPPPQQQMYMQQQMPDQYVPRAKSVGFHQQPPPQEPAAPTASAAQDNFRSSSRVLAPPGGGSSICFG